MHSEVYWKLRLNEEMKVVCRFTVSIGLFAKMLGHGLWFMERKAKHVNLN